jgi:hypothetical protein
MRGSMKIDLPQLKRLKEQGKDPKEIAKIFKVSLAAVYRAIPKLARLTVPASFEELTPKQQMFIQLKNQGLSGTEAACRAFDVTSRKSGREISSVLLARPDIQDAMADHLEWVGMGRGRRAEILAGICENSDPQVALGGLREAMKASGDYPPQQHEVKKRSVQYVISYQPRPEGSEDQDSAPVYEKENEERYQYLRDRLPNPKEDEV